MNDYSFGNYIYNKRIQSGDSQNELARKLGVTGKAISKWENGTAKPKTETIRKLAALWQISIDDLLRLKEKKKMISISNSSTGIFACIALSNRIRTSGKPSPKNRFNGSRNISFVFLFANISILILPPP